MTTNEIHIGSIIEQRVRAGGHSVSWLAGILCCERTNVYSIFRRRSIDSGLLYRISEALRFDFFALYSNLLRENELDEEMEAEKEAAAARKRRRAAIING